MKVQLTTTYGKILIELDRERAPETVDNFVQYVRDGHYDGTVFHRVIGNFMIQGGGFTPDMQQKPTRAPIRNEAGNGLSNETYTLAMARTSDPHSATAQFFINVADNHFLDKERSPDGHGYATFGKVIDGIETINKIKAVGTGNKGFHQDVPKEDVIIESAKIIEE